MSGHSKWANIKHKKEKTDNQRGKVFTKIGREIAIAVKEGGSDPLSNAKLRDVIAKAKASNLPNDNIARSIKKAAGELNTVNYEEVVYEGYGPSGVAVIVEAVTDNRNRTAGEMRYLFDRQNGSLGATGCVSWMFNRSGVMILDKVKGASEDEMMMNVLEAGAQDFEDVGDAYEVLCDAADFSKVRLNLEEKGYRIISASIERIPQNKVDVPPDAIEMVELLLDKLDDHEDVQSVYHNANLPQDGEDA
ncbi:MAG: YebC/PmpR family DNA-binding transcriptional regulator [Christensenellales bacterium]